MSHDGYSTAVARVERCMLKDWKIGVGDVEESGVLCKDGSEPDKCGEEIA